MNRAEHPGYQELVDSGIDLAPFGLELCDTIDVERYFCTPEGAEIFGRTGVCGVHFCFVDGYEDVVFCVCPMNLAPRFVRPVAWSFEDFLSLMLTCGGTTIIEAAWRYSMDRFYDERKEVLKRPDNRQVRVALWEKLGVLPMTEPYTYIHDIQEEFDYSAFDVPDGAAKKLGNWKVYYDKGLYYKSSRAHAGEELRLDKSITLNGHEWRIPSVYVCSKGLVIDLLHVVDNAEYAEFYARNREFLLLGDDDIPERERRRIVTEDPLNIEPRVVVLYVNGKIVVGKGATSCVYDPVPEHGRCDEVALAAKEQYGLDDRHTVVIWRLNFEWKSGVDELRQLRIVLTAGLKLADTLPITVDSDATFIYRGKQYFLRIREVKQHDDGDVMYKGLYYPRYYTTVSYKFEPVLMWSNCRICDYNRTDKPREWPVGEPRKYDPPPSIRHITRPDGTVVVADVMYFGDIDVTWRRATSAMSFDKNRVPDWHLDVYERAFEGAQLKLW